MKKREIVYIVQAYDKLDETNGVMSNVVVLELYADSIDNAVEKAQKLIHKNGYRVERIIEK